MLERALPLVTVVSMLGCGLMAGVFFIFSVCIMPALNRLPPAQGITAMQAIDAAIITPLFMLAFLGTAAVCLLLGVVALVRWSAPGAAFLLIGSALYLVGAIGVSIVFNIPRNDALDAVNPESADAARFWLDYVTNWTIWNHVRTVTSLAATVAFLAALWRRWF